MVLWHDFLLNEQRPIHKWKHYFPIYERHFSRFINMDVVLIEIGCGSGGSLQMWKRFFGPHARIIGIDIDAKCASLAEDQIEIRIGDQSNPEFLQEVAIEFGSPDIVVDDGSHMMHDVLTTFQTLCPLVARNGIYFIEDLHTAYWDEYGGGLRRPTSFMEYSKNLIDELNADHSRGMLSPTEFTRSTLSIHFYDSVIVFEKGRYTSKHAPRIGKDPP